MSEAHPQGANEWFDHTLYSRLNDKQQGAIVLIMYRLHGCLPSGVTRGRSGRSRAGGGGLGDRPPAGAAEGDEAILVDSLLGPRCFERRRGEALRPAREPRAMLERIRRTISEYNFAGQVSAGPGIQLIQELIADGLYAVTRYQPQSDKVMRSRRCQRQRLSRQAKVCFAESMHAQTAMIENGLVHLPDIAPWLSAYLHELTTFPNSWHADQVASTAQMLDWFKPASGTSCNAGIFELTRRPAEAARRQQAGRERRVRLLVPPGVGRLNLLHPSIAVDGTVEMPEEEAGSFVRAG